MFGERLLRVLEGLVVKVTIYPELFCRWRARFQKKIQGLFVNPLFIAFHEVGTLLVTDTKAHCVFQGRLSNPVEVSTVRYTPAE